MQHPNQKNFNLFSFFFDKPLNSQNINVFSEVFLMVRATIVVENMCQQQGLLAEWGYSVFLENPSGNMLWDTGGYLHVLEHNLRTLQLDIDSIRHIGLSHSHFDHTAGLLDVLRLCPRAQLWGAKALTVPRWGDADHARNGGGGSIFENLNYTPVDPWREIMPEVIAFTVPQSARDPRFVNSKNMWEETPDGEIIPDTFQDDVSLLVKGDRGYSLVLGCAHAGLPNIMRYAAVTFDIDRFDTVMGGTHLVAASDEDLPVWMDALQTIPVNRWRPNHCTGFKAAAHLAKLFDDVLWAGAGYRIEL